MASAAWLSPLARPARLGEWGRNGGACRAYGRSARGGWRRGGTYWGRRSLQAAPAAGWRKYGGARVKQAVGAGNVGLSTDGGSLSRTLVCRMVTVPPHHTPRAGH